MVTIPTAVLDIPGQDATTEAVTHTGDFDRFTELLTRHWDSAYRYAYHLTGNVPDAEDLVQQAAEEALVSFRRFQPGTRFDRWLMRIVHNSFIDRIRRGRRLTVFSLDDVHASPLVADRSDDPEAAAEAALHGLVLRALQALPPEFRAAVILVDLQGLPYGDAAEILHCPVGTIRSRLHRGRLTLRELLRPHMEAVKRGEA
ncbi:MAG: sigma-70 family RNA polymerase sigma factor [Armatimonadota bacterium]|nr:sigma-70 family RNA polymerase sigma factor [Armatimonadota bacterium]